MWHEDYEQEFEVPTTPYGYYQPENDYTMQPMHGMKLNQDVEYSRPYDDRNDFIFPEVIKNYLLFFQKSINSQNLVEIQNAYENGFNKLTEKFFKNNAWPEADQVSKVIIKDKKFLILYKELYYRHIYARVQTGPSIEQRFDSYTNYCALFNYILNAESPVPLDLPNQWLWDIIDEFIYQYQSFSQFRSKLGKLKPDDVDMLRSSPKTWNVHSVLNVLHSLIEKSNINKQLDAYTKGEPLENVAGEFGSCSMYKMLGYFSLVGLLRLHSLLGDYHQALKVIENMNFNRKSMYSRVSTCHITTCYYVGFAYMMMRRFQDAIRTFSNILLFIQRTKQHFQTKTYLYDQINKQNDQMFTLLAICLALHPICVDETVHSHLREKYADKIIKMQKGDLSEFESNFQFACPKFLSPVPPNYDANLSQNFHMEPYQQQLNVFMREVRSQLVVPTIRSYLKLYTTLPISKLSDFMETNEEELMANLMCFKHKMNSLVWVKGISALDGELQSASEVDFYVDKNMIHIADTKVARRYGDFFIRNILKFQELNQQLHKHSK